MAKILVVDDERVLVKGIKFNLENEGYQVEVGFDGEEAVEKARQRTSRSAAASQSPTRMEARAQRRYARENVGASSMQRCP